MAVVPVFVEYPSIYNADSKAGRKLAAAAANEQWVATEKVHGSNFGFACPRSAPGTFRMQRRTAMLAADEDFMKATKDQRICAIKAFKRSRIVVTRVQIEEIPRHLLQDHALQATQVE